jgi:hypothetical protein
MFLAAATNDLTTGLTSEKVSVVLSWPAVYWALGLTFLWDLVELWVRGPHFKFLRTQAFWIYYFFHAVLSILATIALGKTFDNAWVIGLLAAISNEMILSNANITFGTANILPLLDQFKKLRVVMQQKIDDISKAATRELIEKLSRLPRETLEAKLTTLLIQNGKQPGEVNQLLNALKAECGDNPNLLATKLANDFIQLDPEGSRKAVQ